MQIVNDLLQVFFCFFFTCHITETDALRGRHINFGIAFSHTECHRVFAAHLIHHLAAHILAERNKDHKRKDTCQQKACCR